MPVPEQLAFFRQQAPEFNNLPDAVVTGWFNTAQVYLAADLPAISASKLDLGIALYAAHLCWLTKYPGQGGASRGPITEEKDGDRSKKYELIINSASWLGQSLYGQAFSNLTGIFDKTKARAAILTRFGVLNSPLGY